MSGLISVIIPVYNAERTLGRCLDSVFAQTHKEIEVICIVDGSRDSSTDILYRYAEREPRLKVIEQESSGPATARNAGLDAATGDYIGFVDADDYINPLMYERLLSFMQGAELANCGHKSFFPDGSEKSVPPELNGIFEPKNADGIGRLLSGTPDFIWDKLYDAHIIRDEEVCFPDGRIYGEDTVFLNRYLSHVRRAVFIEEPLYHYNAYSEGSITNTISDRWYDIFENLKDIIFHYKERLDEEGYAAIKPYLEELCIRYYDRRANAMIRYDERGFQIRYVKYSFEFLSLNFPDWKARMTEMPGILFPRVKTSFFLMRLYILAPGFLKARYAERLMK